MSAWRVVLEDDPGSAVRRTPNRHLRRYLGPVIFQRLYARARALNPLWVDFAVACVVTLIAVLESFLGTAQGDRVVTALSAMGALLFPLTWRRRDILLSVVVFGVFLLAGEPLGGFLLSNVDAAFFGLLILLYSVGRHGEGRRFWIATAVVLATASIGIFLDDPHAPQDALWLLLLFVPPILAGRGLRSRAKLQAELHEKVRQAEATRDSRARTAADEERQRIAAELQVAVADAVSAIVVQAETVPHSLERGETRRAEETFAAIEATGRDALAEMRRLLGVLRHDGEGPELAPQPGLARLSALIERVREQGIRVELLVSGDERPPAPGVDLTAYRVIQDALEAAVEKGATRAEVEVRFGERDLEVAVRDDRTGDASQRLPGLRDRVGLYGGHLRAGREDGKGFALETRLPLTEAGP
jgi:signal transduction histidine kinase